MEAKRYMVSMTGETPLLLHGDNLPWAEMMKRWEADPANKSKSVAGDDRTPAWRWIGSIYHDGQRVVIPADNLMTVLREGGKRCPTGKRGATFKAQTQSGILVDTAVWPLLVNGTTVNYEVIKSLINVNDFEQHERTALELGFELFVKRAKIGMAKHVRVRPRFDKWACQGTVTVFDEEISLAVLQNILTFAGVYAGMGDWRPSSPKSPGPFGKFTAVVKEL